MPHLIREEQPGDQQLVRHVNEAAFGRSDEADLIDGLREEGAVLLSLVAEVKFAEWTGKGELRQPVYLGLRSDKRAKDVKRERERSRK